MPYFSAALEDALQTSGLNQRDLASAAGLSPATISKIRSGAIECSPESLADILRVLIPWPQLQWNLAVARCKDFLPEDFRHALDSLDWKAAEDQSPYRTTNSSWDNVVETIRKKGLYNEDLRQTIVFLAEVA